MMDRSKRQDTLFDLHFMPTSHWGWIVEYRLLTYDSAPLWSEWGTAPRPNHFRSEQGANDRVVEMKETHIRPSNLGIIEFRVSPKYLGYIPDSDEAWIKP